MPDNEAMSVEVRECDRQKLFAVIDEYQHYGTKDALAKINELFVLPERSAAAEEIERLRAVVEAADGLRDELQRVRDWSERESVRCEEGARTTRFHTMRDAFDSDARNARVRVKRCEDRLAAYRTARAACDSQNAESDPQDGLPDTGDTQGGYDDSV